MGIDFSIQRNFTGYVLNLGSFTKHDYDEYDRMNGHSLLEAPPSFLLRVCGSSLRGYDFPKKKKKKKKKMH